MAASRPLMSVAPARDTRASGSLLRGVFAFMLLLLNTLFWSTLLFIAALVKLALPFDAARRRLDPLLNAIATGWVSGNSAWMRLTQRTAWELPALEGLDRNSWYLVSCNHQSWVDILVLQRALNRKVPLLKFFLKRELLYVPVMGLAWWALDFPFMRRHSKADLRRNPALRSQDEATALKACAKFRRVPTCVMNFVEGTRFTAKKHAVQASPYRHLLKPKTGALASSLQALGPQFSSMLDFTIVYPGGVPSFWQFLCGATPRIVVRCTRRPVPVLAAADGGEGAGRAALARWLAAVWEEKDREIDAVLETARAA
jgi:1-acyl-sn-glycerol-3-phosphate acyltransferase